MKEIITLCLCCLLISCGTTAQQEQKWPPELTEVWEPEPKVITGATAQRPPSDAIVLFNGSGLDAWKNADGGAAGWKINSDGTMTVVKGTGPIFTKEKFGSCQLHIEWKTPDEIEGEGQGRGNSGVFLQNRYEVQILDSYQNRTYSNGQAGAIYKQYPPLVNAMNPTGKWQTYDIIFTAPEFNADGMKVRSGYITVLHNGVLIQNHSELQGTSEYIGLPKNIAHGDDGIQLQDHGNPTSFRNIWIRKL